jgi:hypothetical protein
VTTGKRVKARRQTAANTRVRQVKGANMAPKARTVPRSVMKQAPRIPLPKSVRLSPVSSITAYTTAMEVVDMAIPASQLAPDDQPSAYRAMAAHPRNGARKLTIPTTVTSRHLRRMTAGSSSAPARKVRTTAPVAARNVNQGWLDPMASAPARGPRIAAAATPTRISVSAPDTFRREAKKVATRASPNHRVAMPNACSIPILSCGGAPRLVRSGAVARTTKNSHRRCQ